MKHDKMNEHNKNERDLTERQDDTQATVGFDEAATEDTRADVAALTEDQAKQLLIKAFDENKTLKAHCDELEGKLSEAAEEAATNKDSWYRCAAEFENFKKRNADARQNAYFDGKKDAILSLLVIGDSVDRALSVELDDKTREGVMLIKRQFAETLAALNVEEIDPSGQAFDPTVSEAIATVAAAEGEGSGVVKTVYKKGYKLSGKMLRYAQVIVTD